MLDHLLTPRGLLYIDCLIAVLLCGALLGVIWTKIPWPRFVWPLRLTGAGLFITLVYGLVGQEKAFKYELPFDHISWLGLTGMTVLNIGFAWIGRRLAHKWSTEHERG